jgi:enterochelin esterase-like enzyme
VKFLAVFLVLLCVTAACAREEKLFTSLGELHAAINAVSASGDADSFWNGVLAQKKMPLIFDETAVFLWRGAAKNVEWRGDFSSWESAPETQGKRIGKTDIWEYEGTFPGDSRLDYKLVIDSDNWILDPLNPHQQVGGYGPNSEVRMRKWHVPENTILRNTIARGEFSKDIPFKSARLGYDVNYRVYTPAGFNAASKNLPVLYVTDGSDYWRDEMGSMVITMDNLIAENRIVPIIVVFIDPWDRKKNVNRREEELIPKPDRSCNFCDFIAEEFIPSIDSWYPTRKSRDGRAILGASYGGLHATFMSIHYASLFSMAGVQSPGFGPVPWLLDDVAKAAQLPAKSLSVLEHSKNTC